MLFLKLLQISVGTLQGLSFTPSAEEWGEEFDDAMRQALVGVCFRGVQCTIKNDDSKVANLPPMLKMQWECHTVMRLLLLLKMSKARNGTGP